MRKMLLVVFLMLLPFLSACTPQIIRAGAERDMVLYNAQTAHKSISVAERIALANIPACRLVAKEGEEIMMSGIEVFECYGGVQVAAGESDGIQQRVSPAWSFLNQNSAILGMLGFGALMFPNGLNPAPAFVQPEVIQVPTQVIRPEVIFAP